MTPGPDFKRRPWVPAPARRERRPVRRRAGSRQPHGFV